MQKDCLEQSLPMCNGDSGRPALPSHLHFRVQWDSSNPLILAMQKKPLTGLLFYGGEGGIRTHGGLPLAGFQDRFIRPSSDTSPVTYVVRGIEFVIYSDYITLHSLLWHTIEGCAGYPSPK